MSKESVLDRVAQSLAKGDRGTARDRLNRLVFDFPDDLALRARLASVYHELGLPVMAGRFWFFEEDRSGERAAALAAFEHSCGGDPLLMLSALKFRGNPELLPANARERLDALRSRVRDKYAFKPRVHEPSRMLGRARAMLTPHARAERLRDRDELRPRWSIAARIADRFVSPRALLTWVVVIGLAATGLVAIVVWALQAVF